MEKDKIKLLPWLPEGAFGGQPQTLLKHFCPVFLLPLRGSSMSRAKSNNLYSLAPWYCTYSPPTVVQRGSFSKNQSKREMLSPFSIGNTSSKGPLSCAMLVYRSVIYLRKIKVLNFWYISGQIQSLPSSAGPKRYISQYQTPYPFTSPPSQWTQPRPVCSWWPGHELHTKTPKQPKTAFTPGSRNKLLEILMEQIRCVSHDLQQVLYRLKVGAVLGFLNHQQWKTCITLPLAQEAHWFFAAFWPSFLSTHSQCWQVLKTTCTGVHGNRQAVEVTSVFMHGVSCALKAVYIHPPKTNMTMTMKNQPFWRCIYTSY